MMRDMCIRDDERYVWISVGSVGGILCWSQWMSDAVDETVSNIFALQYFMSITVIASLSDKQTD